MNKAAIFDVEGHLLTPIHSPQERLDAVLSIIENAQETIRMSTYMFRDDATGKEVLSALVDAAQRGVFVQLMIDNFGSGDVKEAFFAPLVDAGGIYRNFSAKWNLGYLVRNHQKILIADGKQAIVGGFNITDRYFGRAGSDSWEDFGIIVDGPNVSGLVRYYDELIKLDVGGGVRFRALRLLVRRWHIPPARFGWLIGGPTNRISPWAMQLKHDLERGKRLDLVSAYFSPSQTILRRISRITRKGNSGRIVLAGKSDNGATIGAARSLYRYLLKRDAQIYEFEPRPLHMKLMVIDEACYIGSANLDVRSLFINMEIMLRVEDKALAQYLRGLIEGLAGQSVEQTLKLHRKRSGFFTRIYQGFAYMLVNSLDFTIGRRIKFGLLSNMRWVQKRIKP